MRITLKRNNRMIKYEYTSRTCTHTNTVDYLTDMQSKGWENVSIQPHWEYGECGQSFLVFRKPIN